MKLSPSIFVSAAFIGPGTITTASLAGANFGYSLLWALLLSVFMTMLFQGLSAKLALATNRDLAANLRDLPLPMMFKPLILLLVIGAIVVGNAAYQGGNISGAALGLSQLFPQVSQLWVPLLGIAAGLLLLFGSLRHITTALTLLVGVMALVFILCSAIAMPSLSLFVEGISNPLPAGSEILVLALIGTTLVPYNLFLHSALVAKDPRNAESHRQSEVLSESNRHIAIGGLITLAVLSTSAVAFFGTGTQINGANLANQLQPLLGEFASAFFATGLFSAGLTSAITAPMAAGFCLCSLFNWPADKVQFKAVSIFILALGTLIASSGYKPLGIILFAQVTNGLLLPIIALILLWLTSRRAIMQQRANGPVLNLMGIVFVLVIAVMFAKRFLFTA